MSDETQAELKVGDKVSFLIDPRAVSQRGSGIVFSVDSGGVVVAVDSLTGGKPPGYRMLALFNLGDLTKVS